MRMSKTSDCSLFFPDNLVAMYKRTLNARSETVHDKPAFRHLIMRRRCMLLVNGFFEWHHHLGKTFPYFIYLKGRRPFALAGIWDEWNDPDSSENIQTFSVVTTEANTLLAKIHKRGKLPEIYQGSKRFLRGRARSGGP